MAKVVVSLAVLVVLGLVVAVLVSWRDRNRLSSEEDVTAVDQAGVDQHRHEAERHFASGMAARHHNPPST
ncbi:hypothetical protein [Micromonospora sp. RP3T]|uniref:hypothetical protein n=1 Tax=Micromonospora sp. RP3T TaxID=2135446 RepID=UPI000D153B61|nr:hypothetical protein [Micromonospora sp. RP3T]PTA44169.1 hypothetical protein C8054_21990 [Micromonospora sp. RP3T]